MSLIKRNAVSLMAWFALLLVATGCSTDNSAPAPGADSLPSDPAAPAEVAVLEPPAVADEAASLADISELDALRDRFNAAAGSPRLILLLSPT